MKYLITGAASGIGRAVAQLAAKDGEGETSIALVDRDIGPLEELAHELTSAGVRCIAFNGDLADPEIPGKAVARAVSEFGGLDSVISNAGTIRAAPIEELTLEAWEDTFAINTRATWLLACAAFPSLKESRGSIVATVSISATNPTPPLAVYSASKAAVRMIIQQLALEWGRYGIRCNAVSPGPTDSGLTKGSFGVETSNAARKNRSWREQIIPLRKIGRPEEVAEAILFLAGPRASQITGVDLAVDGGLSLTLMPVTGGSPDWVPKVDQELQ